MDFSEIHAVEQEKRYCLWVFMFMSVMKQFEYSPELASAFLAACERRDEWRILEKRLFGEQITEADRAGITPRLPKEDHQSEGVTDCDVQRWDAIDSLERAFHLEVAERQFQIAIREAVAFGFGPKKSERHARRRVLVFGNPRTEEWRESKLGLSETDRPLPQELLLPSLDYFASLSDSEMELLEKRMVRYSSRNSFLREQIASGEFRRIATENRLVGSMLDIPDFLNKVRASVSEMAIGITREIYDLRNTIEGESELNIELLYHKLDNSIPTSDRLALDLSIARGYRRLCVLLGMDILPQEAFSLALVRRAARESVPAKVTLTENAMHIESVAFKLYSQGSTDGPSDLVVELATDIYESRNIIISDVKETINELKIHQLTPDDLATQDNLLFELGIARAFRRICMLLEIPLSPGQSLNLAKNHCVCAELYRNGIPLSPREREVAILVSKVYYRSYCQRTGAEYTPEVEKDSEREVRFKEQGLTVFHKIGEASGCASVIIVAVSLTLVASVLASTII